MNRVASISLVALLVLAACSSTSTGQTLPSVPPASTSGAGAVTFMVVVPGIAPAQSKGRRPAFIAPSTQSIVISLHGTTLMTADVSAASHECHAGTRGSRTCNAKLSAPSGNDDFTVTAFDGPHGNGNQLASGTVAATLTPGTSQIVHLSLTGTPATLGITLGAPYVPAGTAATSSVTVTAYDADGNTIVGAYAAPITVKDADTTGATKLSATTASASSSALTLSYDGSPLSSALLSANGRGVTGASAVFAPSPTTVAVYQAPQISRKGKLRPAGLGEVCQGPDGNMWATATSSGGIERITLDGAFTTFPILGSVPMGISVGSDKNLWFAENGFGAIAKITTAGKITSYKIPTPSGVVSQPAWTALGPDGRTWFVDDATSAIAVGAITPQGKIAQYALPAQSDPVEITTGPDGNLWITDGGLNAIDVMSPSGKIVAIHHLRTSDASPWGITVGPDKNIWFAEFGSDLIGRMTTGGALKEYTVPTAFAGPLNVTAGPDGNVWFTETGGGFWDFVGKIGYVTPTGSIRDFPSTITGHFHDLSFDTQNHLWFTEFSFLQSALGKVVY
jgi:streptogramin lyase